MQQCLSSNSYEEASDSDASAEITEPSAPSGAAIVTAAIPRRITLSRRRARLVVKARKPGNSPLAGLLLTYWLIERPLRSWNHWSQSLSIGACGTGCGNGRAWRACSGVCCGADCAVVTRDSHEGIGGSHPSELLPHALTNPAAGAGQLGFVEPRGL